MGNILGRHNDGLNLDNPRHRDLQLKLETQRIGAFDGDPLMWPKWKVRARCALQGTGFGPIMDDREFAEQHPDMNAVVYAQLSVATVEGHAHFLIQQFDATKDGHRAWEALHVWYDGDEVRCETAETIRDKIDALRLTTGKQASWYINKFLGYKFALDRIDGEGLTPNHSAYLFLKGIEDSDYSQTVSYLRNTMSDLYQCVNAIRRNERLLSRKVASRRTIRAKLQTELKKERARRARQLAQERLEDSEEGEILEEPPTKRYKGPTRMITVDDEVWRAYDDETKKYIQEYNARIKHKESTKDLKAPAGFKMPNSEKNTTKKDVRRVKKNGKRISFEISQVP